MHKLDILALVSRIAGLSVLAADTTFQSSITALFGPYGVKIIAAVGLAGIIATDIIRVTTVPTQIGSTDVKPN